MRAMQSTSFVTTPQQLSPAQLRLLKQAERVLQSDQDTLPSSPCVSVCRMSEKTGLCEGCFRTIDEITGWGHRASLAKREVWRLITQRIHTCTNP
jgi:predicted Fe-S protein YdhL (DUF1289 family)